ncbi:prepilin peptidase [Asticcacaulis sp. EMRT-3]|uniref:A24 family peptidase n=1 Tax=Asticcacaulis sp. EMRT-3 TaxID=3040349 RepID=UPI0024AEF450|nr:prepilin peptidase [Asticcacaulis sp. EMRT-3]MDI7776022.1 prepilin peptidase [Asticcacaulis sp. EMRT-3]
MLTLLATLFALVYPACLLAAAFTDLTTMTIPNRLTIGLAVAFVPAALLAQISGVPFGLTDWGIHLGLGALGLVLGMVFFALRFMGGGDAKLIAAASLWLGWHGFVAFLIYTALAGGALTLALLGLRQAFPLAGPKLPAWLGRHFEARGDIPYGIAIAIGGLAAIWQSDFLSLIRP